VFIPLRLLMASSSQNSARSPSISPSGTQEPESSYFTTDWQRFALDPETKFDIVGRFRELEDVKWARKQFRKRHLMPLLKPVYHLYHPRFVRLFYRNLKFDTDQPGVLFSEIEGEEFQVTVEDVAEALGCPHENFSTHYTEAPAYDLHMIVQDMCDGAYENRKRNCTSKAKLPSRLWLVDTVLKRNVCPLGHKIQRSGPFLAALYAFHKKHWFSAPQLIWSQIYKCWETYVDKRIITEKSKLPFPYLITKLLVNKGFEIEERHFVSNKFQLYTEGDWNKSVSHMRPRVPAPVQDEEMPDAAAEMAQGEPSAPQGDRAPISQSEYELLQAQFDRVYQWQDSFAQRTEAAYQTMEATLQTMGSTLQEILSRLPPPPPAPPAP
jgi:hypothetical protein